jgi:hypothetical protein
MVSTLAPVFRALIDRSILRPTTPAAAFTCTECGERPPLVYLTDVAGKDHAYIHCSCGPAAVADELLQRWEFNTPKFLEAMFRSTKVSVEVRVAGHLWTVGTANWAGRAREVWFLRSFNRKGTDAVVRVLKTRKKAILFTPSEAAVLQWQEVFQNPIISLESVVSLSATEFLFDTGFVESKIIDAGLGFEVSKAAKRPQKRADRVANIEKLTDALISHLRAAQDHARHAEDTTGEPALLPRPTQKELANQVDLTETQVSRCFGDSSQAAKVLNLYWEIALDLDQIIRWQGPIETGRLARESA